ncbi:MAG: hypothetical protein KDA99_05030 [Planctomycetales bacterium]|nr:hypothetical protein [Planctomycetales bacterium]
MSSLLAADIYSAPDTGLRLVITASSVPRRPTEIRLLPADTELEDGNAAVVLLRMIWEQQHFMQNVAPQIDDLAQLPFDDPKVANDFHFDNFYRQMRHAAYMRDAKWEYPLNQRPLSMVLLPDVQGMRQFAGRGMKLWINQRLASQDHLDAIEGLRVQLACARHVSKTPFLVSHLVAYSVADAALDNCETLMSRPRSPNLYYALGMLPEHLGDVASALQWEAVMLERSLPSLDSPWPDYEDAEAWERVAADFSQFMEMELAEPLGAIEAAELSARMLAAATGYLSKVMEFSATKLAKMTPQAIVTIWVLELNRMVQAEVEAAYALPQPQAIAQLLEISKAIEERVASIKAPATPFLRQPWRTYLGLNRFQRRVKYLQTIEAIRDYAAKHEGKLPSSLADLSLPVPHDPLTSTDFEYQLADGQATLAMPLIAGVEPEAQTRQIRQITVAP